MSIDAPDIGEIPLAELVGGIGDLRGRTLESLTGSRVEPPHATRMIERIANAWQTPLEALTCAEVRLLLLQDMGMRWLGPIACEVAARFPDADAGLYPGDLATRCW